MTFRKWLINVRLSCFYCWVLSEVDGLSVKSLVLVCVPFWLKVMQGFVCRI